MDHSDNWITEYKDVDIIICGNPGVGKSTLLSSISKEQFKSGISFASGLTTELKFKESRYFEGTRFGDTPGLADLTMAKKAAEAITSALRDGARQGRNLKIFFVVTETNGRVRPEDLFTIKQVMESIKLPSGNELPELRQNEYGVIINQCALMNHPGFKKGREHIEAAFYTRTKSLPYTTTYIKFLPRVSELENKENAQFLFGKSFFEWIFNLPGIRVEYAHDIDVSNIKEKLALARDQSRKDLDGINTKLGVDMEEMRRTQREMMQKMQKMIEESKREKEKKKKTDVLGFLAKVIPFGTAICEAVAAIGNF